MPRRPVTSVEVERITREGSELTRDLVAVEEPLQILLEHGPAHARAETPLAMTMRTPGNDLELVAGFLFGEGVVSTERDLIRLKHCERTETPGNVVRAVLRERVIVPSRLLERRLPLTSACGVCGERTVKGLTDAGCERIPPVRGGCQPDAVRAALRSLESSQVWFQHTGGTHGAALFDETGALLLHREDVGRHNAVDKLIGACLFDAAMERSAGFIVVSSRASFELVQKTVRAGIPMMVAIGAPTSLAIETAERFGVTLVGFAREGRFNVYAHGARLNADPDFVEVGAAE